MTVRQSVTARVLALALGGGVVLALPAPSAQAAGPAVTGLTLEAGYDSVFLNWDYVTVLNSEKVVCVAPGTTPPAYAGCTEGYRGQSNQATVVGLQPGQVYSFAVYALDGENQPGEPATATLGAGNVSISVDRSKVTYGDEVTFRGTVTDARTGEPIPDAPLTLGAILPDSSLGPVAQFQANYAGDYELPIVLEENYPYAVLFSGGGENLGGVSGARRVNVASLVILDPVKPKVKLGKPVQLVAGAAPVSTAIRIVIQQLIKKKWVSIVRVHPDTDGIALVKVKVKKKGTYSYRAYRPGVFGTSSAYSKPVKVKVT